MVESTGAELCAIIEDFELGQLQYDDCLQIAKSVENTGKKLKLFKDDSLDLVLTANQLGTIALKAQNFARSQSLLEKALAKYLSDLQPRLSPFAHLYYNLGNLHMAKKDHLCALDFFKQALAENPFAMCADFSGAQDESKKF